MFDPLFISVAATAVFLVGLSKSGLLSLGGMAVPMLTLVMPARDAAGMMLPLLLVMDVIALAVYRREADLKILKILIPGALIGTGLGWALSAVITEAMVRLAIGLIVFVFVLDAWLPLRKKLEGIPPSPFWGRFWSAVSGFTSFISHAGGPPIQIYLLPLRLRPVIYAGTNAVYFAVVNAAKIIPYFFLGQLSVSNMTAATALMPVAILGMGVGVWLVRRVNPRLFYNVAYILTFTLSLKLIWDGMIGLLPA